MKKQPINPPLREAEPKHSELIATALAVAEARLLFITNEILPGLDSERETIARAATVDPRILAMLSKKKTDLLNEQAVLVSRMKILNEQHAEAKKDEAVTRTYAS